MPRNLSKRAPRRTGAASASLVLLGLLMFSSGGVARAQSQAPPITRLPSAPAAAAPVAAPAGIQSYSERHAEIWTTTIKYVYADDPELSKISSDLLLTADGANLKTVTRGLDEATQIESKKLPKQARVLKLQGIFKEVEAQKPGSLPALVQAIQAKLESNDERMQDPVRRQRLGALITQLRQAAAAPQAPFPDRIEPANATGAAAAGALTPAQTGAAALPAPAPYPPAAPETPSSWLPMLSLVLSVLSLLGVVYLLVNRARPRSGSSRAASAGGASRRTADADNPFSSSQYNELRKTVQAEVAAALAAARPAAGPPRPAAPIAGVGTAGAAGTGAPAAPAAPLVVAAAASPAPAAPVASLELITAEPAAAPTPTPTPPPQLRTIYVNQPPLDGAFRRDNLADAPASYTIFEITVDVQAPEQGAFVVARNEATHGGYIGLHHSVLEAACVYLPPQGAVSRIITDVPGTVQRLDSGDWQINQKAQIHFA